MSGSVLVGGSLCQSLLRGSDREGLCCSSLSGSILVGFSLCQGCLCGGLRSRSLVDGRLQSRGVGSLLFVIDDEDNDISPGEADVAIKRFIVWQ